jgi:hypothetical protein
MFSSIDPDLEEVDSEMIERPGSRATLPPQPPLVTNLKELDLEEERELT